MTWDDYEIESFQEPDEGPSAADDPAVLEIEPQLLALFDAQPQRVFFESQLAILFERRYFHWVTVRALKELRDSGQIMSELVGGDPQQPKAPSRAMRFYFNRRNRYWRRKAAEVRKLVEIYSDETFTNAVGNQGELLIDAGLPRVGFHPVSDTVRSWGGVDWTSSGHDLDRVFERDGIYYGAEIKNRLGYIDRTEFAIKLNMCEVMGLRPLFIARMMPKTYINDVRLAGGYSMIMGFQFYPLSHRALALRVRNELELPVDTPRRLEDGTLQRFLNWHERNLPQSKESSAL